MRFLRLYFLRAMPAWYQSSELEADRGGALEFLIG